MGRGGGVTWPLEKAQVCTPYSVLRTVTTVPIYIHTYIHTNIHTNIHTEYLVLTNLGVWVSDVIDNGGEASGTWHVESFSIIAHAMFMAPVQELVDGHIEHKLFGALMTHWHA